jgi:PAP2 superfamily
MVLAAAVVGGQVYLVAAHRFLNLVETPFLAYSLAGSFAIHFWTRPGRAERLITIALAIAAAATFALGSGRFRGDWPTSVACAGFFGLASLVVLAGQVCRLRGAEQDRKLRTLMAGSVFGFSALFIAVILNWTTRMHPRTYDLYLYTADAGYRLPISRWAGQLVASHGWLAWACGLVYETLPLAVSLVYAYERSGSRPVPVRVLPAFLGGGAAAYLLYNFLPAAGPHYVFGEAFPNAMPEAAAVKLALVPLGEAARNAVPSMHIACALLISWCCAAMPRWVRAAAALYLALTVLATLGFGEHYVVDLVAAVPYALALAAICATDVGQALSPANRGRKGAAALGVALTLAWMAALRYGTPLFHSATVTWGATLATLGAVAAWPFHAWRARCGADPNSL